jgi:hypothetical protein
MLLQVCFDDVDYKLGKTGGKIAEAKQTPTQRGATPTHRHTKSYFPCSPRMAATTRCHRPSSATSIA